MKSLFRRSLGMFPLLFLLIIGVVGVAQASGSKSVVSGQNATLSWSVPGSLTCNPSFTGANYPNNAAISNNSDTFNNQWSTTKSSVGSVTSAAWGSNPVSSLQSYGFKCTDPVYGQSDTATLNVYPVPKYTTKTCTYNNGTFTIQLAWPASDVSTDPTWYPQRLLGPDTSAGSHATGNSGGYPMYTATSNSAGDTDVTDQVTSTSMNWTGMTTPGTYQLWMHTFSNSNGWSLASKDVYGSQTVTCSLPSTNNATCSSISAPASVTAGASFTGTVVMQNSGNTTWTSASNYNLGSQSAQDNTTWGTNRVSLPSSTAPGSSATFSRTFTAPNTTGSTAFAWEMVQDGVAWFGGTCSQNITVVAAPVCGSTHYTCTSGTSGANSSSGSSYTWTCSNTATTPATVSCSEAKPDLTVSTITPTSATPGGTINLASTVSNSTAATGAGFYTLFQKADDSSGTNATDLGTYFYASSLAANGTVQATYSYTVPSAAAGTTIYIRACADKSSAANTGVINESNENNNCGTAGQPWTPITVAAANVNGSCSATHYNCVTGTSINTNFDGSTYTWQCQGSGTGSTATCSEIAAPSCAATHYNCTVGTSGANNGSGTSYTWTCTNGGSSVNCSQSKPDLTVSAITPTSASQGSATVLKSTVSNSTAATGAGFYTLFQKADDSSGTNATDLGTYFYASSLAANGTVQASYSYTFPGPGVYYIRACADKSSAADTGAINESNENNNCGTVASPWTAVTVNPTITASAGTGGSVTPAGVTTVAYNGSQTYTITPTAGNIVADVLVDGSSVGAVTSYPFSNVISNRTISASFASNSCSNGAINPTACDQCPANYFMNGSNICTAVTVSVSATTPLSGTQNQPVTFTFSPSTNTSTTDCRLLDNNQTALTAYVTSTTTVTYTAPNGTGPFTYYIQCRNTTYTGVTKISNPITLNVSAAPAPDLTAGMGYPTSANSGSPVSLSASITNIGNASTGSSFPNFIQVSNASQGGGTITNLASTSMATLAASASATTSQNYTFPSAGTYSFRACANTTNNSTFFVSESNTGNNCGGWTDVTVTTIIVTGQLTMPATCTIAANGASCPVTVSWTTQNATTTVTVDRAYDPFGTIPGGTGPFGNTNVSFYPPGSYTLNLMHGGTILDSKTITISCTSGTTWNGTTGTCQVPQPVITVNPVPCNHTTPCSITFSCQNADTYTVSRDGTILINNQPYTGPVTFDTQGTEGNYAMTCHNSVGDDTKVFFYDPNPLLPKNISLLSSPRTVESGSKATLSWSITNPTSTCKIVVTPVCTGACGASQTSAAQALQTALSSGTTDSNDPYGASRSMTSALQTVSPADQTATKALGKKTLQILYTTDFLLGCGTNTAASSSVRVVVSKNNEG